MSNPSETNGCEYVKVPKWAWFMIGRLVILMGMGMMISLFLPIVWLWMILTSQTTTTETVKEVQQEIVATQKGIATVDSRINRVESGVKDLSKEVKSH